MREGYLGEKRGSFGMGAQFKGGCVQFRGEPCEESSEVGAVRPGKLCAVVGVRNNQGKGLNAQKDSRRSGKACGETRQVAGGGLQVSRRGGGDTDGSEATACRGRGLSPTGLD